MTQATAAWSALDAIRWSSTAVEHDDVPVLSGTHCEKQQEGVEEVGEILKFIYNITFCYLAEHKHSENWEHEENKLQKHENVHQWRDREHDCLNNRLKSFFFT